MAPGARSVLSIRTHEGARVDFLVYSNEGCPRFAYRPDRFEVSFSPGPWRAESFNLDELRLELPPGWLSVPANIRPFPVAEPRVSWLVYPHGMPPGYSVRVRLVGYRRRRAVVHEEIVIPVEVHGYSQFDPSRHALEVANSVADLGKIRPQKAIFARTYERTLFPEAFFAGLYRSIVFIEDGPGDHRGGLCAGMARLALEQSHRATLLPADQLVEEIQILHGRQLTDRTLFAAAPWFFLPSPRRAFARFRADLFAKGWSDVCFDIGVPRPWRRDVLTALVRMGHVVVPYAFRQKVDNRAEVWVYDSNHPPGRTARPAIIEFDLAANSYAYRPWARHDDRSTTVVAVPQAAYRNGRTALLASLANLILFPRSIRKSGPPLPGRWGVPACAATALGVAVVLWRRARATTN